MHDEQEGQHFNACSQHTETGVGGSAGAQTPPGGRAQTLHFQRREDLTGGLLSGTSDKSARTPVSVSSPRGQPTPFRLQTPSKTGARRRACACRAPAWLLPWWDAPHGCQPWLRPHSGNSPQNQILGFRPRRGGRSATLRAMTEDLIHVRGGTFLLRCPGRILSWGPDSSRCLSVLSVLAASADLVHTGSLTGLPLGTSLCSLSLLDAPFPTEGPRTFP